MNTYQRRVRNILFRALRDDRCGGGPLTKYGWADRFEIDYLEAIAIGRERIAPDDAWLAYQEIHRRRGIREAVKLSRCSGAQPVSWSAYD